MTTLISSVQLTRASKYKLNDGHYIPVAGFGVADIPLDQVHDLVYEALVQGYRQIDSAVYYGNETESAQAIAQFLKDHPDRAKRSDIWFTTKINDTQQGYEEAQKAVSEIADRVKPYIGYVDLVLIHVPAKSKNVRLQTWKALQEFASNPSNDVLRIQSIGVSNYGAKHLEELLEWDGLTIPPAVNQLELHPWLPRHDIREVMLKYNILPQAYSPLTRGKKFSDPELVKLAKTFNMSVPEILLRWAFIQGFVVLAKTANKNRIKENIAILPEAPKDDPLGEKTNWGKVDLDFELLKALDMPDSNEVLVISSADPTIYQNTVQ